MLSAEDEDDCVGEMGDVEDVGDEWFSTFIHGFGTGGRELMVLFSCLMLFMAKVGNVGDVGSNFVCGSEKNVGVLIA